MDNKVMAAAMAAMGWDPKAAIPMANAENRALLKQVDKLFEQRAFVKESIEVVDERLRQLALHEKIGHQTVDINTKVIITHKNDIQQENHLYKLTEAECSKLKSDLREKSKEIKALKQHIEVTDKELKKRQCHLDKMIGRMQWAKTAMVEWRESMEAGRKGYQLIEKYFKEDEQRAREKDQRRQFLQNEIDKIRKKLVEMYDEQRSLEQCLHCTANLYRAAHAERRDMVQTWKNAVNHMTAREREIAKKEMDLHGLQIEAKTKDRERRELDNRLNEIIDNNRQVEAAIDELNNDTSDIKEQIQKIMDLAILKENEVDILQKELQNLSNRVQVQRTDNRQNEKLKNDKLNELKNFDEILARLNETLLNMQGQTMNAQQRLQMLESLMDNEEKQQQRINRETCAANSFMYRSQQQLAKLKDDTKVLEMSNDGLKVNSVAIRHSIRDTEKELNRQTEVHYALAFKLLQIERRIIKLEGGSVDPDQEQKHLQHLMHLENLSVKINRRLQATESQNKKLDDNMRKLTIVFNEDSKKLELINFHIKEAQVYCDGGIKRVKQEAERYKNLTVELSLLRMRSTIFEEEIEACDESSYNLEKHRLNLGRTIKDRMVEIKSQQDLLLLKRKHLSEEKSTLRADIGERNKFLDAVRARFELTAKLLGENEDGSLVTATQLKVETAQEKQLLLEEGNQLNEQVMVAETEVEALENTLMVFNRSNETYRKTFKVYESDDEATNELTKLQLNYCKALECVKSLRKRLNEMQFHIQTERANRDDNELQFDILNRNKLVHQENLAKINKELNDQDSKLHRAEREMKLALKSIKQRPISEEFMRVFDMDLDLRELDKRNMNVLNHLSEMAECRDELGVKIIKMLLERDVKLPHQLCKSMSLSSWRSDYSDYSSILKENLSSQRSENYVETGADESLLEEDLNLSEAIDGSRGSLQSSGSRLMPKKSSRSSVDSFSEPSPQLSVVSLKLDDDAGKTDRCRKRLLREHIAPTIANIKGKVLPSVCSKTTQRPLKKCTKKK